MQFCRGLSAYSRQNVSYLATVCAGTSVRHGEDAGPGVLQLEVLVIEFVAVDGLAPYKAATNTEGGGSVNCYRNCSSQ